MEYSNGWLLNLVLKGSKACGGLLIRSSVEPPTDPCDALPVSEGNDAGRLILDALACVYGIAVLMLYGW